MPPPTTPGATGLFGVNPSMVPVDELLVENCKGASLAAFPRGLSQEGELHHPSISREVRLFGQKSDFAPFLLYRIDFCIRRCKYISPFKPHEMDLWGYQEPLRWYQVVLLFCLPAQLAQE